MCSREYTIDTPHYFGVYVHRASVPFAACCCLCLCFALRRQRHGDSNPRTHLCCRVSLLPYKQSSRSSNKSSSYSSSYSISSRSSSSEVQRGEQHSIEKQQLRIHLRYTIGINRYKQKEGQATCSSRSCCCCCCCYLLLLAATTSAAVAAAGAAAP